VTALDGIRIQKFLSMAGRASRREAEGFISAGRVQVNGIRVTELGTRVVVGVDRIEVDGEVVTVSRVVRWYKFHKPPGVVTTRSDPHADTTIYDVLPAEMQAMKYLGRLDRATEGLLLLSDDGDMINKLLHPSGEVEREYEATVAGTPTPKTLRSLTDGIVLGDGPARAKRVELVGRDPKNPANGVVRLVLTEGRKREVRRMLESVGHHVLRLIRVRFGVVELGDLPAGEWRPLKTNEIDGLRALVRRR